MVVIAAPNVGKSSLLNALAGADLAIVTPIPGTTRDRIGQTIELDGVPLHVVDTAGLRSDAQAADAVERIGIGRSWQAIEGADAVLLLHDSTGWRRLHVAADADSRGGYRPAGRCCTSTQRRPALVATPGASRGAVDALAISARTGAGIDALKRALLDLAGWQPAAEGLFTARARHVQALRDAAAHLRAAQQMAARGDAALELLAEELRLAHQALATITGAFGSEDLLGAIFGSFCIGK